MPGGKGKSTGGKAGPKEAAAKSQKSHSAKAGLQVSSVPWCSSRDRVGMVAIIIRCLARARDKNSCLVLLADSIFVVAKHNVVASKTSKRRVRS